MDEPVRLSGEVGRGLDPVAGHGQDARHGIDDEPRPMKLRAHHQEPPALPRVGGRHVEAAALIDHGQHFATQVHDALQEGGRAGHAGDPVGQARHLVNRLDGQAELLVAQAEHHEPALLDPGRSGPLVPLARSRASGPQPLHHVLPEQSLGREDRDESLASIDGLDPRLAPGAGGKDRGNRLDARRIGRKDGLHPVRHEADKGAANPGDDHFGTKPASALPPSPRSTRKLRSGRRVSR
jgi:hypothetical protein